MERLELRGRGSHFRDRAIQQNQIQQFSVSLCLCGQSFRLFKSRFGFFIHEQTPDAAEETIHALDAFGVPRLRVLQRPHEHFVKPERIRAVFHQHVVGIHHVAARLGHLLSVFAENQSLIDEFVKRFRRRDVAEIEQNLVPEPRVKQMQHGVFRAADV